MCGIAGLLSTVGSVPCHDAVAQMINVLRHRGPDTCGIQVTTQSPSPVVVLGHTRLAILDLSSAGRQPMHSAGRRHAITYNGEIYNFRAVAARFPNAVWRTRTDTEVLLQAYAAWGRACVEELRGMFAFAIWDADRQELFLARDRLGIKPLYYYAGEGLFAFASEVRALLASGLVPRRVDPVGLRDYLTYQSLPAPRTMIDGVHALPPGSWLVVDAAGHVVQQRYWDLLEASAGHASDTSLAASHQHLAVLLREAVAMHLVSDVPLGAFLSGGIDSSMVVGLMREAGHLPHTFSVVFSDSDSDSDSERAYDEARQARSVATRFGTEHTEILLREQDLLDQMPGAMGAMDQPTGDGVNTYVVAGAVRRAGITVALSGLGGDELFAGYPSFIRLARTARLFRAWGHAPHKVRSLAADAVRAFGRFSPGADKAAAMLAANGQLADLYPITRQVLSPRQRAALLTPAWSERLNGHGDPYVKLLRSAYRARPSSALLASISYAEGRTYMHDVLLRDTDQMSMAHALEVRVPLLDHVLVEYVMGLPDVYKRANGTPKPLLVNSLPGLLPEEIVHRPKHGFTLPFAAWMRGQLRAFCEERLGERGLGGRDIFQPDALRALWSAFLGGRSDASWSRLWVLVVLEEWLERNGF